MKPFLIPALISLALLLGTSVAAADDTPTPTATPSATATPSPTATPTPASITIIESAPCNGLQQQYQYQPFFNGCPSFTFVSPFGGGLPGFTLRANASHALNGLAAGQYQLQQLGDSYYPLLSVNCTSDRSRGNNGLLSGGTYSNGGLVVLTLHAGENVICTFNNGFVAGTATPTATATSTPVPAATATPTAVPTLFIPPTPVPQQPIIVNVTVPPVPTAQSAPVAAVQPAGGTQLAFKAPNTGDAGLASLASVE